MYIYIYIYSLVISLGSTKKNFVGYKYRLSDITKAFAIYKAKIDIYKLYTTLSVRPPYIRTATRIEW